MTKTQKRQRRATLLLLLAGVVAGVLICTCAWLVVHRGDRGRAIIREKITVVDHKASKTNNRAVRSARTANVAKTHADRATRRSVRTSRDVAAGFTVLRKNYFIDGLPGQPGLVGGSGAAGPQGVPGTPGTPGSTIGPTDEQVHAQLEVICATKICGFNPTLDQVISAVRDLCGDDKCRGPAGPSGAAGPPPSNDDLREFARAAAIEYCATAAACAGSPGPTGPSGPPGSDGPVGPAGPKGDAPISVTSTRVNDAGTVENCVATDPDGDLNYACP